MTQTYYDPEANSPNVMAEDSLLNAVEAIDTVFEPGYAKKNPALIAAVFTAMANREWGVAHHLFIQQE